MPPHPTPKELPLRALRDALFSAFDEESLEMLTSDYFGPARTFSKLTNSAGDFQFRVHKLLERAQHEGWLLDLVTAARKERGNNKDLAEIAEKLGTAVTAPRPPHATVKPLDEPPEVGARPANPSPVQDQSTNLLVKPTLIGRDALIKDLLKLIGQPKVRLLTLTGPSGVGKTSLAKYLAASLDNKFEDGVFFVHLSSLKDPNLLPTKIGDGMPDYRMTVDVSLADYLRQKQRLVVLDNFDTVTAAAPYLNTLLEACPKVKFVVTCEQPLSSSHQPLMGWEVKRGVPGLPEVKVDTLKPASIVRFPAARLFVTRAEALKDDGRLVLNLENAQAIAAICNRLNGLPLCIEIIASFITSSKPPEIQKFLKRHGFKGLDPGKKLYRAIGFRYDELSDPAIKVLFRRLSVFTGGCSFEAIWEVCRSPDDREEELFKTLKLLVDISLLQAQEDDGRYQMLHVIREYAGDRLEESGEAALLREKCARYHLEFVKAEEPKLKTSAKMEAIHRIDREYDNLISALDWSVSPAGDLEVGLTLAGALFWYWNFRASFKGGQEQVRKVLRHARLDQPSESLARALYCDGGLTFLIGTYREAQEQLTRSVEMWRKLGNKSGLAYALIILGMAEKEIGHDLEAARRCEEEGVQLLEGLGDKWGHALALNDLGNVLAAQGESFYAEALKYYEQSRSKWEAVGDRWGLSLTLNYMGSLACKRGDYDEAFTLMRESEKIQVGLNDRWGRAWSLKGMGEAMLGRGDLPKATPYLYESFHLHWDLGRKQLIAECLEGLARVAGALGQPQQLASLLGAAEELRGQAGSLMRPEQRRDFNALLSVSRAGVSDRVIEKAISEGRGWDRVQLHRNVSAFIKTWKKRTGG